MLDWVTNTVTSLGYFGIALLMFLENICPPIPSEIIMPLAGFVVAQGKLNFVFVVIAGIIGSVLGAVPWYYLGKYLKLKRIKKLAAKYGKWITVSEDDVVRVKRWFDKRGNIATCLGRMVPGIRTFISVPAGISEMNELLFLGYSTLGTAVWVGLLTYAGYILGANYDKVEKYLAPASPVIMIGLAAVFVVWIIQRRRKQK